MKPEKSEQIFRARLRSAGHDLATLLPKDGIAAMLDFYVAERAEGCPVEEDGDMLLFQWGHDSEGNYYLDLTRQFSTGDGDEHLFQLALTFVFAAPPDGAAIADGNKWFETPEDADAARAFIESNAAYLRLKDSRAVTVTLVYDRAG